MKEILIFIACLFYINIVFSQESHIRCSTVEYLEYQIKKDPQIILDRDNLEHFTSDYVKNYKMQSQKSIITIPVVVHVIYNTAAQNISDAQVYSQIDVLNKDFRRLNTDTNLTPAFFKSIAADCEIEFCLAKQDPQGNYTNGITRTQSTVAQFDMSSDAAKYSSMGGHDIWNRNNYLNIWVVPAISDGSISGILGYAQLPAGGSSTTDGVVICYQNFGTIGNLSPYFDLGRTVTHEVGHWLNLYHIWGDDGTGCWGTDEVDDTPNQADENYNCPTFPSPSCNNTSDMYSNYMDYTDDACMNIFTQDQKARMLATLNGFRSTIKSSSGCILNSLDNTTQTINITIIPNPNEGLFTINSTEKLNGELMIFDVLGKLIYQEKINSRNSVQVDLSNNDAGLYIAVIKGENFTITKKIQFLK